MFGLQMWEVGGPPLSLRDISPRGAVGEGIARLWGWGTSGLGAVVGGWVVRDSCLRRNDGRGEGGRGIVLLGVWCCSRRDTGGKRGYDGVVGVGMTERGAEGGFPGLGIR